jgi:hypothetical protein
MLRLPLLFGLAAALYAQDVSELFHKPPADVDRALRARVSEFFQYHVTGEFRKAEPLVAEDTKEYFYDHDKPRYLGFEIQKIIYNEDFTKANAVVLCDQYLSLAIPGFQGKRMKLPTSSFWKLENGQWYWYVDPASLLDSPMGRMKPGTATPAGGAAIDPNIFNGKVQVPESAGQFFAQVKPDRQAVELKPGGVDHVTITNGTPGPVSLEVLSDAPGVRAHLDHADVKPGEKTTLSITALDDAESGVVNVRIKPMGPAIPIQVTVKAK